MYERPNEEVIPRCPACGFRSILGPTWKHDKSDDTYECLSCGSMFMGSDMLNWKPDPWACSHEFIDTGLRRSWCKHCDLDVIFDGQIGHYVVMNEGDLYDVRY